MVGFKRKLGDSIQVRLSFYLSLGILFIALIAGTLAYFRSFDEAQEFQDDLLRQVASIVEQQVIPSHDFQSPGTEDTHDESHVFIQVLSNTQGAKSALKAQRLALPDILHDGLQTVDAAGTTYRLLVKPLKSGERLAVAQDVTVRDEMASESLLGTLTPLFILIPLLIFIVAYFIRKIFKAITRLSLEIDERDEQDLHSISAALLPLEIKPFVAAINRLLKRVRLSMDAQHRFVADAAHELRSPLTALSLQAERLSNSEMSVGAQERLARLREGIDRGRKLLDQLLALARLQASAPTNPGQVSIQQIFRRVLEDLMPLAESKGTDIGVTNDIDTELLTDEMDLITLVKNLVDNAIRYSPQGGRVDLSIRNENAATRIIIEDNGPGIPETEWQRVFAPFYRILGSRETGTGLGLSIVDAIANRLNAKVSLAYSNVELKSGLQVSVIFPNATQVDN